MRREPDDPKTPATKVVKDIRRAVAERGAWANIPPMPQRKAKPVFSRFLYHARNLVKRFFNKLKHFRAVATRHDKDPDNDLAMVKLASIRIWMRFNESVTSPAAFWHLQESVIA